METDLQVLLVHMKRFQKTLRSQFVKHRSLLKKEDWQSSDEKDQEKVSLLRSIKDKMEKSGDKRKRCMLKIDLLHL